MTDRHKRPPVPFRPPEGDRAWLYAYAERHGLAVNAILRLALAEFRAQRDEVTGDVT